MTAADSKARADELIELLDLTEFAERVAYTYSGGQRRRLDVAIGLMNRPRVLFLDEPTTGLDPQNRANLWSQINKLRAEGATIFLTTHYLDEADVLCDRLAIMDEGKIVVEGTPEELKKEVAHDCITISVERHEENAAALIDRLEQEDFVLEVGVEDGHIRLCVGDLASGLPQLTRVLDGEGVAMETVKIVEATLDDVFLQKTGYSLRDLTPEG
jgi:ABC-2 type transport system ATP-binding protein